MDPFATVGDMESRTQGQITAATHPFLATELAAASRLIRGACRWHVAPILELTYRRVMRWPTMHFLPAMEIQAFSSVMINGTAVDPSLVEIDPGTGETNLYGRAIEVVYTAGFEPIPEDLVMLTLELAAGGLGASTGVLREMAGSVSVTLARSSGAILPDDEARLAPYRLGPLP